MKALLLVSHGSRSKRAREEVVALAEALRLKTGMAMVQFCFLDVERPDISEGIARCVDAGAKEIVVLPHFLTSGKHVSSDIPNILNEERKRYLGVKFAVAPPVGAHERIAELLADLIARAV